MEKRPNINDKMTTDYHEEYDDRVFRIMIGICGIVAVIMTLMLMAAGALGIWALFNFALSFV